MEESVLPKMSVLVVWLVTIGIMPAAANAKPGSPFTHPKVIVAGLSSTCQLASDEYEGAPFTMEILRNDRSIASYEGHFPQTLNEVVFPHSGRYQVVIRTDARTWTTTVRALPGIVTVLPPVLAILMALLTRQVVVALVAGVWLGGFVVNDYNVVRGFFYVVDHYVIESLSGSSGGEHVSIAIFTMLLGGMVGVFSRIGGTLGVVDQISRLATSARRGQLATWLMGVAIFFDDYTNTLIVGNTMRPITDRLKISREKLSYIVDSTAAPVACVAVITSWIGFEVSLIGDAFESLAIDRNPFTTFVASIPYSFYPLLTLLFGVWVAISSRDFGPMLRAERRARSTGQVLSEKAVPLANIDQEITFDRAGSARWFNAVIPIGVVVIGTFLGLVITGYRSVVDSGGSDFSMMHLMRQSDSFVALLWSSLSGCVVAILLGLIQRLASLTEIMNAWVAGVRSMVPAIIILVLAWAIGAVCTDLQTAAYLVHKASGILSPTLLPTIIFLIAAAVSFSTGTSWGTMTILTPIAIPLVIRISEVNHLTGGMPEAILLGSISAVLAGSVFGDHCSPISDTTIMSSMASGADHVDHVRTQLPYAVAVALISVVVGYIPAGFDTPAAISLILGAAAIVGLMSVAGKRVDS